MFCGLKECAVKKSINNKLKNQFSTISESVEDVLSRSGSIKTPIGSVKATSALKFAKGLGTFGAGLNIISAVNYFNEIRSGNSAKGYAGLGMMAATSLTMGLCPPCALAALAGSATYSLYLEDKIFKPKK